METCYKSIQSLVRASADTDEAYAQVLLDAGALRSEFAERSVYAKAVETATNAKGRKAKGEAEAEAAEAADGSTGADEEAEAEE
eukprot:15068233-Alexandrium_andersonii.AAC.1